MQPKPLALRILDIVAIIVLVIATYMALTAPLERVMGEVQKVFYFHVGTASQFSRAPVDEWIARLRIVEQPRAARHVWSELDAA